MKPLVPLPPADPVHLLFIGCAFSCCTDKVQAWGAALWEHAITCNYSQPQHSTIEMWKECHLRRRRVHVYHKLCGNNRRKMYLQNKMAVKERRVCHAVMSSPSCRAPLSCAFPKSLLEKNIKTCSSLLTLKDQSL